MRLNKFIALSTGLSRREADEAVAHAQVTVNGEIATMGMQVNDNDSVRLRDQVLRPPEVKTLIMLNKPRGYVSSRNSQSNFAKTLYELLPAQFAKLKTVGRLDRDSSGLILLTDDGDFAFRMTHPKFVKNKTYLLRLDRGLAPLHQQMISDFGVDLPDGKSRLTLTPLESVDEISRNDFNALKTAQKIDFSARTIWRVQMSEGRNRQIRRTFAALGYEVQRLHRIEFGEYQIGNLAPGEVRKLALNA